MAQERIVKSKNPCPVCGGYKWKLYCVERVYVEWEFVPDEMGDSCVVDNEFSFDGIVDVCVGCNTVVSSGRVKRGYDTAY
jgi:hypothetical protein